MDRFIFVLLLTLIIINVVYTIENVLIKNDEDYTQCVQHYSFVKKLTDKIWKEKNEFDISCKDE